MPDWAAAYPATAHVFLDALTDEARVEGDDGRHLARVRRVRVGESVTGADGRGTWRPYVVEAVEPGALALCATADARVEPALAPGLEVAFALTKGAKPETVVQHLTELGVDRIRPVRAEAAVARLRRVAREAAMQCRRARLPEVDAPGELGDLAGRPGLVVGDPAGIPAAEVPLPTGAAGSWLVLVGPEGGFEPAEIAALGPLVVVRIGPHVLRAETAAIALAATLASRRGIAHAG